jgi:hypothetical protein
MLRLIDGDRSLADIHSALAAQGGVTLDWEAFIHDFEHLFAVLNGLNLLFLERAVLSPAH